MGLDTCPLFWSPIVENVLASYSAVAWHLSWHQSGWGQGTGLLTCTGIEEQTSEHFFFRSPQQTRKRARWPFHTRERCWTSWSRWAHLLFGNHSFTGCFLDCRRLPWASRVAHYGLNYHQFPSLPATQHERPIPRAIGLAKPCVRDQAGKFHFLRGGWFPSN